jgi:hypothetical protein
VNVNGGGQFVAQVGSSTATSSGYYVMVPGGVPQIVAKYNLDAVLKLLLNPPIATPTITPTDTITAPLAIPSSTSSTLLASTATHAINLTATRPPLTSTPELLATATLQEASPTETPKP